MAVFTPEQFAAQGGQVTQPNPGSASTLYQSFVKNNLSSPVAPAPAKPLNLNYFMSKTLPSVGLGIAKSVPQTLINAGDLGEKALNGLSNVVTGQHNAPTSLADTVTQTPQLARILNPQNKNEEIGNTIGQVAQLFVPTNTEEAGASLLEKIAPYISDLAENGTATEKILAKLVQGATKATARGADIGAKTLVQTDNPKQALEQGALGAATVPAEAIGGKLLEGGKQLIDNTKNAAGELASKSENAPKVAKLTPEQQDLQNNIVQSQKDLEQAKSQADFAAEQRKNATPQAVEGVRNINTQVSGNLKNLGEQFGADAAKLEKSNPNLKLNLTNEQVDALNALKENKNFVLPDKISKAGVELSTKGGGNLDLSGATPEVKAQIEAQLGKSSSQNAVSLSPTEAQGLIKELNRSTFRQTADGGIAKDYQRIGITNEIKDAASKSFGEQWDNIYSKYAQGRGMIDKLDSIVNLDSKATPEDLNKQLEGILKQSKTPEGKLLLQQAVDEYKQSSGVDLNDPIQSIQKIADHQTALDEANSALSDAQKASNKAQRDADIAKLKQEQKMSTFKGRHPVLTNNLQYFVKRAAWGLTGGTIIGALGLSGVLKKVFAGK